MERGEEICNSQQLVSDRLSSKLRSHHPNILFMPNHSSHGNDDYRPAMSPSCLFNKDECQSIVKRTVKAFLSLHDLGMSLLRFDASNIFWSDEDGEVKLGGLVLIEASPASKKMDFQFLARAVQELFQTFLLYIPLYLENLIERMDDFRDGDGDLLVNHMALKSVSDRLDLISSVYERRNSLIIPGSKTIYFQDVVDKMSRSSTNSKDWRTTIVDKPGAVFDCFNYKPSADPAEYRNTNLHILRFSRNMVTHLRQHLIKYEGFEGTADEIDSIIMNMFGHELLSFQKLAYDHGILKDIMPGYISRNNSSQQKEGTPPQNSTIHEDEGENDWIRVRGKKSPCTQKKKLRRGEVKRG